MSKTNSTTDLRLAASLESILRRQGTFTLGPLTLDVPRGRVTGFVGPNGSGKTTTIKAMLGMTPVHGGQVSILGGPVSTQHDQIGVVLDDVFLVGDWTPLTSARAIAPSYQSWNDRYYQDLLARFDIPTNSRVGTLSQGQSTKLMLALALAHDPQLLILDEPTSGLDPLARQDVLDVFREFMVDKNHSILFSTHITTDLDKIADYVHILRNGETAYSGTIGDLEELYGTVRGPLQELTADARNAVIGLRSHGGYYTGLLRMDDSALFNRNAVIEEPTLEHAIICLGAAVDRGAHS